MDLYHLSGKRVLVMGLGIHGGGLGVVRWLLRRGAEVTVTDMADAESLAPSIQALHEAEEITGRTLQYVLGEHRPDDFTTHDLVVANPAVPPTSRWLALAREAGVPVETEMSLFFQLCQSPILGITGTKGKTTTALMTTAILRQAYPDTVVAGNMRISALELMDTIAPTTPVVLELSSFQLSGLAPLRRSPPYACVTNFSPDHLNYHRTMTDYAEAKQQIFRHQHPQDVVVLHHDLLDNPYFQPPTSRCLTFSISPDIAATCSVTTKGNVVCYGEHLFDVADVQLPGVHNLANALAAAALASAYGIAAHHIRTAIQAFVGVEHRLELVRTMDEVRYINDTTATNPAAAVAALHSFPHERILLIAGGANKGLEFSQLGKTIAQRASIVILLDGNATDLLAEAIRVAAVDEQQPIIYGPYSGFAEAIEVAHQAATPGSVVLLSPGCASFGMFRNEFHRGEEFRRLVWLLAPRQGT